MDALLAFAATLIALRLGGALFARWRARRAPELAAWSASLFAYAVAAAALAWGAAAGWDDRSFRVYYLCGALLTAPLLGAGSLLRYGWSRVVGPTLVYVGLAVGVAIAVPIHGAISGSGIPPAQDHLDFVPARLLAVVGNTAGTVAVLAVAIVTFRRRPLGNALVIAGLAVAALGSALTGLGESQTAASFAIAAALLYGGFTARSPRAA